ncbi:MAG: hypothetical protein ACTSUE_14095 [Promethearchaeota archaeon]
MNDLLLYQEEEGMWEDEDEEEEEEEEEEDDDGRMTLKRLHVTPRKGNGNGRKRKRKSRGQNGCEHKKRCRVSSNSVIENIENMEITRLKMRLRTLWCEYQTLTRKVKYTRLRTGAVVVISNEVAPYVQEARFNRSVNYRMQQLLQKIFVMEIDLNEKEHVAAHTRLLNTEIQGKNASFPTLLTCDQCNGKMSVCPRSYYCPSCKKKKRSRR